MPATNFTPIQLYRSTTASQVPTSGNLSDGELAINTNDEKLYFKNSGGTVKLLASSAGASGDVVGPASATDNAVVRFDGTTGKLVQNSVVTIADSTGDVAGVGALTMGGNLTLSGGTANGVLYLNGSKVATSGSALTFDGTNFATTGALTVGTNNRVQTNSGMLFVNGPSAIAFENGAGAEQMRLTSTGLGIGTSSPGAKLTVSYTAAAGNIAHFAGANNVNGYIGAHALSNGGLYINSNQANQDLRLQTQGTDRVILDSSGNLGLGVTPSAWGGTFKVMQFAGGASIGGTTDPSLQITQNAYYNGTNWIYSTTAAASNYYQSGGAHTWRIAGSGTAGNAITFTQALTLDSGGNLLLGTTSLGTTYGASTGVLKQTGGVFTERGQFVASGGSTTTITTLANASNNQTYLLSVRQSGAASNYVVSFVTAYGASSSATRMVQDNAGGVLDMNITVSGLALRLVLGSGFGSTTWDYVLTRIG